MKPKLPKKKPQNKKLKRSDITDEMRRKLHVCEHDKVGYFALTQLTQGMFVRSKQDAENIKRLTEILTWQKKHIEDLKKINEAMVDRYEDKFEEYEKANEGLKKDNTQLILDCEELKTVAMYGDNKPLKDLALRPDRKKDN